MGDVKVLGLDGLIVAIALGVIVAIALGVRLARAMRSRASVSRNLVARGGELEAETILRQLGYRVVERQARASFAIVVDGAEVPVEVRADLLVSKRGRTYVAEVKTGALAPDPRHPPTRRQLLEYAMVFDAEEILLVDVPARAVRAVAFPLRRA